MLMLTHEIMYVIQSIVIGDAIFLITYTACIFLAYIHLPFVDKISQCDYQLSDDMAFPLFQHGHTATMLACRSDRIEIVQALVNTKHADIQIPDEVRQHVTVYHH